MTTETYDGLMTERRPVPSEVQIRAARVSLKAYGKLGREAPEDIKAIAAFELPEDRRAS